MLKHLPIVLVLLLLTLVATSRTLADDHAEAASEQAEDDGFVDLYNGEDLTGWQTTGNWVPQEDGVLKIEPREGERGWQRFDAYLTTEKKYGNFVLQLEL